MGGCPLNDAKRISDILSKIERNYLLCCAILIYISLYINCYPSRKHNKFRDIQNIHENTNTKQLLALLRSKCNIYPFI